MEHFDVARSDTLPLSFGRPLMLVPAVPASKYDRWLYSRYDWSQFDPKKYGYEVIRPSSKKYDFFTIVDRRDYKRLAKYRWKVRVEYVRDEYGGLTDVVKRVDVLRSFQRKGKNYTVYMARVITKAGAGIDAEHEKGETLDNRRCRLRCMRRSENNHNWTGRPRKYDLPKGVEWGDKLHQTVRGIIWWRAKNGERKCKRTPQMRYSPENVQKCHRWYLKERVKLYDHHKWATGGKPIQPIDFPPLKRLKTPSFAALPPGIVVENLAATF